MPRDDYWRFELGEVADTIPVDGHGGSIETQTYADGYSLTVWLTSGSDSPTGAWPDHIERYRTLDGLQDYAGKFVLHGLTSGRAAYTETHSGAQSNLVGLRPPAGTRDRLGGWYLLASVTDATTLPETLCVLEFELTFVAPLDRYPDHTAAHDALASEGI